jgi:dTDP-4-amino-4,6-dideoxygalactose transaminase
MKIPFVDLKTQYQSIKSEIDSAIAEVIANTAFVGGSGNSYVATFEKNFATYLNIAHVVSCANGTDSLEILLEAFGIKAGDEVIVPAISWISTSEAVGRLGAKPIFVDVCEDTLLMNIELIEEKICHKTKAIIPVHLYGNVVDMEQIMRIATKHNLIIIEDCAQSHGATFNKKLCGTFAHAASFSFYPGKNLGAYGDAGCLVTNDVEIASKCRMIANHGQLQKHNHVMEGRNSRMDGLHAAILNVKLKYLNDWNTQRKSNALLYNKAFQKVNIITPVINKNAEHVFHLYVIQHDNRDALKEYLSAKGIESAIHYPTPLPFLKAYALRNFIENDYPIAQKVSKKILSIPMFPELNTAQINYVVDTIKNFEGK